MAYHTAKQPSRPIHERHGFAQQQPSTKAFTVAPIQEQIEKRRQSPHTLEKQHIANNKPTSPVKATQPSLGSSINRKNKPRRI
jgi:hypothetical protein